MRAVLNVPSSDQSIVAKSHLSLIVSSHVERFGLMSPSMEMSASTNWQWCLQHRNFIKKQQ